MRRIAILGSTRGTDLGVLIKAIHDKRLPSCIHLVISNQEKAGILELARSHSLPAHFLNPKDLTREAYDQNITALLKAHDINLIILIGYLRILSAEFVAEWRDKIINVHPSLLPAFSGLMDKNVHQAVLDAKVSETGCTVHWVTEHLDQGPILLQKKCPVLPEDTAERLKQRVQELEGETLIEVIQTFTHATSLQEVYE